MSSPKGEENVCRTCLSTEGDFVSLFSNTYDSACLSNKIMRISDIVIKECDNLPLMICRKCVFLIESFDCFKKQMESVDRRLTDGLYGLVVPKVEFSNGLESLEQNGTEDQNDSDYEIQYISDEVKRKVERAFKKKQESRHQREMAEVRTTSKDHHEAAHVSVEDTTEEKEGSLEVERPFEACDQDEESPEAWEVNPNDLEEQRMLILGELKRERIAKQLWERDNKSNTSEIENSTNLTITIENNSGGDLEFKINEQQETQDDKGDHFELQETGNIHETSVEDTESSDTRKSSSEIRSSRLEESENIARETWAGDILKFDQKNHSEEPNNEKERFETDIDKKIDKANRDDAMKIVEFKAPEENDKNIVEPEHPDFSDQKETLDHRNFYGNENSRESSNDVETMVEKVVEDDRQDSESEKMEISEDQTSEEDIDKHKGESNVAETPENMNELETTNFETVDNIDNKADESRDKKTLERSNIDEKFLESAINQDARQGDSGIVDKSVVVSMDDSAKGNNEVIEISSDSSDEERRKTHVNQPILSPWKITQNKCLQSRAITPKNLQLPVKRIPKNTTTTKNTQQKTKPRKYFQCTSCNISLYSVSAVLHHHHNVHTPSQEMLSCQMCDMSFPTKVNLYAHFDQHVESHLYRCIRCACEFVLKRNLRSHMRAHRSKAEVDEPADKKIKMENGEISGKTGNDSGNARENSEREQSVQGIVQKVEDAGHL